MSHDATVSIRRAQKQDLSTLYQMLALMGKSEDVGYFERCLNLQDEGRRLLFISSHDDVDTGYGILNWAPKYSPFQSLKIPEIQDLNVVPKYRRRGIASALIDHCEKLAKQQGFELMGIGVGLHYSYGPAQRLYVKLGYTPDGHGVNYDRKQVEFGVPKPVDDDLCLMLVKVL